MRQKIKNNVFNLLIKSQKYTGIDNVYFLQNGFWTIVRQVVNLFGFLILSVVLTRILPQETFGGYNFILAVIGILAIFSLPGMGYAITQAVSCGYQAVFKKIIKISARWSILGSLVLLGLSFFYFFKGQAALGKTFLIIAPLFPFFQSLNFYTSFLAGQKRFGTIAKYETILIVSLISTLIVIAVHTKSAFWLILGYLMIYILTGGYFTKKIIKNIQDDKTNEDSWRYGKKLTWLNVAMTIRANLDKLIVGSFLGFTDLAIYSIAATLAEQEKVVSETLKIIIPKLAPQRKEEAFQTVRQKKYLYFAIVFLVSVAFIFFIPWIIKIFYTQRYQSSIILAQILVISTFLSVSSSIFSYLLIAQKEVKKLYKIDFSFCAVEIIALFTLIPIYGIWGAVAAKLISRGYRLIIASILCRRP